MSEAAADVLAALQTHFVTLKIRNLDDGKPMAALFGGGMLAGLSALILMLFNGRVARIMAFWPVPCNTGRRGGCCFCWGSGRAPGWR